MIRGACAIVVFLCLGVQDRDLIDELRELRRAVVAKQKEAARHSEAALHALDRADYEKAVEERQKARPVELEVASLLDRERKLILEAAKALISDLNHRDIAVRDRATENLIRLGPGAISLLQDFRKDESPPEVRVRIDWIVRQLRINQINYGDGFLRQWAVDATASSEYSPDGWNAKQATGKPDTEQAGDIATAWTTREQDAGEAWIELTYERLVRPVKVRIHETHNPGAVVKIEAVDTAKKWHAMWRGVDPTKVPPAWFEVCFDAPPFDTRTIRITLDTSRVAGWNEIDAVELIGEEPRSNGP
ncbi:MAG: hypothetical protein HY716_02030 [Planctomycetes bacterium]|nr:hypothetical protein [Planctomycetota bacterium]